MKKFLALLFYTAFLCGSLEAGDRFNELYESIHKSKKGEHRSDTYYYEQGCNAGGALGCFNLGVWYEKGSLFRDLKTAASYYEKACDGGNALGCSNLGILYHNGQGVTQDYQTAKFYYEKACDGGNAFGCFGLGVLYHNGQGVTKDYQTSKFYYKKACDMGYNDSCNQY